MNGHIAKRLRKAVWGPGGPPRVCSTDERRMYKRFKRLYMSLPWFVRHLHLQIRKAA